MNATNRYINGRYERCVDQSLDVEAMRRHLADRGIRRSPAMVAHDLDNVYSFAGYVARHQPAPALSVKEFDAQVDRR